MSRLQVARLTLLGGLILLVAAASALPTSQTPQVVAARVEAVVPLPVVPLPVVPPRDEPTTGSFTGKVIYAGQPPVLQPVMKAGNLKGWERDVPDERLQVSAKEQNGIANICIYLQKAPRGYQAPPVPEAPIRFEVRDRRFSPHCLTVRVGQMMLIRNRDPLVEHIHTAPIRSSEFNQAFAAKDPKAKVLIYNRAETIPVAVRSDLHPWMKAYHLVKDHPFMAVTDAKGEFEIHGLPPGEHTFIVWSEIAGYLDKHLKITVTVGQTTHRDLPYGPVDFKPR